MLHLTSAHNRASSEIIPSRAPNFGELWKIRSQVSEESAKESYGTTSLYFQAQLFTTLTQIETTLSRQLVPLNSPPEDDIQTLTPGHFLVRKPLVAIPERKFTSHRLNSLKRWNLYQRLKSRRN